MKHHVELNAKKRRECACSPALNIDLLYRPFAVFFLAGKYSFTFQDILRAELNLTFSYRMQSIAQESLSSLRRHGWTFIQLTNLHMQHMVGGDYHTKHHFLEVQYP